MKKLSEVQKKRNTKILLSDQDWGEEISTQKVDINLLKSGKLNLKQVLFISQRALQRLKTVNDGFRSIKQKLNIINPEE